MTCTEVVYGDMAKVVQFKLPVIILLNLACQLFAIA